MISVQTVLNNYQTELEKTLNKKTAESEMKKIGKFLVWVKEPLKDFLLNVK